jgi:hypothetical protein
MTKSDHKKTYQEYLKEKTFRAVIKNKYVFIKYAVVLYVAYKICKERGQYRNE